MDDKFEQALTLTATSSGIVHAMERLADLSQPVIVTGDQAQHAINHMINLLGLRRTYINDNFDLEIRCDSARVESDAVTFTIVAESTGDVDPRDEWKTCADSLNKAVRALQKELSRESGAA